MLKPSVRVHVLDDMFLVMYTREYPNKVMTVNGVKWGNKALQFLHLVTANIGSDREVWGLMLIRTVTSTNLKILLVEDMSLPQDSHSTQITVVNGRSFPQVKFCYPHPHPPKSVPMLRGTEFRVKGWRVPPVVRGAENPRKWSEVSKFCLILVEQLRQMDEQYNITRLLIYNRELMLLEMYYPRWELK